MTMNRLSSSNLLRSTKYTTWAKVSGGTVTTYTKSDGSTMEVHTFTANGTLTVESAGYAECLLVGGGGGGYSATWNGSGGPTIYGYQDLSVGTLNVVVGYAGANGSDRQQQSGGPSSLGTLFTARSGLSQQSQWGSSLPIEGPTFSITGTAVMYARSACYSAFPPVANRGEGAGENQSVSATAGVVIVAVQTSPPVLSGIIASGGTESTYTGNGTNGVLNQNYKVHKFTTNGTFTITGNTSSSSADVFVVGGGGGSGYDRGGGGGAGGVLSQAVVLGAGSYAVKIGAGGSAGGSGVPGTSGEASYIDRYLAAGGGGGGSISNTNGLVGGSGGGASANAGPQLGASGYGPQGNSGGNASGNGGGGGGASAAGVIGSSTGNGGDGVVSYITGSSVTYGGGGGGGGQNNSGGAGGGGAGKASGGGTAGTANTGGGAGGGAGSGGAGAAGGSGIVIIRYKV